MAARIIIADGLATNRIALKSVLCTARYLPQTAATAAEVRERLADGSTALLVLDLGLPGDALELLRSIRSDPVAGRLPVIAMLDRCDPALRLAALSAGADDLVLKPVGTPSLLARVRSLLRTSDTHAALAARAETVRDLGFAEGGEGFSLRGRVALVADMPGLARSTLDTLARISPHAYQALAPDEALALADGTAVPDVFVLYTDPLHPADTLRLLADLRAMPGARHSATVVVDERTDPDATAIALDLGANALVGAGVAAAELALHIDIQLRRKQEGDRLRAAVDERLRLAVQDPLTGLFNRRYAMAHLQRLARSPGIERTCVIVADIDRFKAVNDCHGHSVGDRVLIEVAHRLRDNLRGPDMVARIGGEEFLILLRETDPEASLKAAERLCDVVRKTPVALAGNGPGVPVTISLGLAMIREGEAMEDAVERADRALFEAKSEGRDKVTVSQASCAA